MNLDQQVCTLEQAKRLKELGVRNKSIFLWMNKGERISGMVDGNYFDETWDDIGYHAYTSAELGDLIGRIIYSFTQSVNVKGEYIEFFYRLDPDRPDLEFDPNPMIEAHARAEFLIYLLENIND